MSNKLLHVFFEVDMRNQHRGLKNYAIKRKASMALSAGDCVVFINRRWNRLKMFASSGDCLIYLNLGDKGRINPETIAKIPSYLNGKSLDYRGALKEAIEKQFEKFN